MRDELFVRKMRHEGQGRPNYFLAEHDLNRLLGSAVRIEFTGRIECIYCGRSIKKTYNQGYCFPCFQRLARCDLCVLKPERCHYHKGTCREPEWGEENCLREHVVYLANTSELKVGLTRAYKTFERWGDQGAVAAVEFARVPERRIAGLIESDLRKYVSDRSDWRAIVTGKIAAVDLLAERERLSGLLAPEFKSYLDEAALNAGVVRIEYPVLEYLNKAQSHDLGKDPVCEGELKGIRGQYLLIGERALNVRKHGGFQIALETI